MRPLHLLICVTALAGACYSDEMRTEEPLLALASQSTSTVLAPPPPPECREIRIEAPPTERPPLRHPINLVYPPGVILSTKEYIREERLAEAYVQQVEAETDRIRAEARLAAAAARRAHLRNVRAETWP